MVAERRQRAERPPDRPGETRPARRPDPFDVALAAMVRADIEAERRLRGTLRVVDGGKR